MVWILRQILHQPVAGEEEGEEGQQEKLVVEPKVWRLKTGEFCIGRIGEVYSREGLKVSDASEKGTPYTTYDGWLHFSYPNNVANKAISRRHALIKVFPVTERKIQSQHVTISNLASKVTKTLFTPIESDSNSQLFTASQQNPGFKKLDKEGQVGRLGNGSLIKLGVEPCVEVLLKEKRVVVAVSGLKPDESKSVQEACEKLGIKINKKSNAWDEHTAVLVMSEVTPTPKFMAALTTGTRVVSPSYIQYLLSRPLEETFENGLPAMLEEHCPSVGSWVAQFGWQTLLYDDGRFPKKIPARRTVFSGLCFVSSAVDKSSKWIEMCLTHGGGTFEVMPDAASASEWKKGEDVSKVVFVWEHNVAPDDEALKAFQLLQLRGAKHTTTEKVLGAIVHADAKELEGAQFPQGVDLAAFPEPKPAAAMPAPASRVARSAQQQGAFANGANVKGAAREAGGAGGEGGAGANERGSKEVLSPAKEPPSKDKVPSSGRKEVLSPAKEPPSKDKVPSSGRKEVLSPAKESLSKAERSPATGRKEVLSPGKGSPTKERSPAKKQAARGGTGDGARGAKPMARTATMVPVIDDDCDGWNGVEAGGGLQGGDAGGEDEEGSASQAKKHNVAVFEPRRANATQMGGQQNGGGPADAENAGGALVNRKRFRKNACPLDVPKSAPVVWTPYIDHGDVEEMPKKRSKR